MNMTVSEFLKTVRLIRQAIAEELERLEQAVAVLIETIVAPFRRSGRRADGKRAGGSGRIKKRVGSGSPDLDADIQERRGGKKHMAPKLKYKGSNYQLTTEEKVFAEKNHNLIYKFLNQKRMEIDEYYGEAATGYIIAVMEFNRRPELRKYKFSVIAYKKMLTSVGNEIESRRRYQGHIKFSMDENREQGKLGDYIADTREYFFWIEQMEEMKRMMTYIMMRITEKQREILLMKLEGYKTKEIMKKQKMNFMDYFRNEEEIKNAVAYVLGHKEVS